MLRIKNKINGLRYKVNGPLYNWKWDFRPVDFDPELPRIWTLVMGYKITQAIARPYRWLASKWPNVRSFIRVWAHGEVTFWLCRLGIAQSCLTVHAANFDSRPKKIICALKLKTRNRIASSFISRRLDLFRYKSEFGQLSFHVPSSGWLIQSLDENDRCIWLISNFKNVKWMR